MSSLILIPAPTGLSSPMRHAQDGVSRHGLAASAGDMRVSTRRAA
jgi:hypothetical protein